MAELLRCDICLKTLETVKCNECTFNSCAECITTWYSSRNNKHKCPQCKRINTFEHSDNEEEEDSEYTEESEEEVEFPVNNIYVPNEVIISDFSNLNINVIEQIIRNGRIFPSENFIQNFNNWPENIRDNWRYDPITMNIDDTEEIIAYSIHHQ